MKKSSIYEPSRQSPFAIAQIIYKSYISLIKQLWPVLILFLVRDGGMSTIGYMAIATVVLSMIVSIIRYFRYYYYIKDDALVVQSGLLTRSVKNIPFDKIQTIDFEQNIIHKIFNVVKVKIDTAGTAKEEMSMDALTHKDARTLREFILSSKKMIAKTTDLEVHSATEKPDIETITSLSITDLLKAGMLENHLRSGGIILFAIYSLWERIREVELFDDISTDDVSIWMQSLRIAAIAIVLFSLITFLFSLVRIVLKYYDLTFARVRDGFVYRAGLFTTQQVTLKDHKIQTISWSNNLLKSAFGIYDVYMRHASSQEVQKKKSLRIPGCSQNHIDEILTYLYHPHLGFHYKYHVHKYYLTRFLIYVLPIVVLLVGVFLYMEMYTQLIVLSILAIVIILQRYLKTKKLSVEISDEILKVAHGSFAEKHTMLPIFKIQGITASQSPYQRRKHLSSLTIYTAAQNISIPYLPEEDARYIYDYLLYKTESSKKDWM